jgi:hypothetical protein
MCSVVWRRKHKIGDGLIVLAQILIGEAPTVIGARLLGPDRILICPLKLGINPPFGFSWSQSKEDIKQLIDPLA